ncbi:MAG: hypothetical protein ACRC9G_10360 [Aeromonas veronii]
MTSSKPVSRRRQWADKIAKMAIGDSFFLDGKKPKDVMFLYQAAYAVDAKLQIVAVEVDAVYMTAGTRVKRVS